jgi:hypothetical protein
LLEERTHSSERTDSIEERCPRSVSGGESQVLGLFYSILGIFYSILGLFYLEERGLIQDFSHDLGPDQCQKRPTKKCQKRPTHRPGEERADTGLLPRPWSRSVSKETYKEVSKETYTQTWRREG